jgi:hypothetical protein
VGDIGAGDLGAGDLGARAGDLGAFPLFKKISSLLQRCSCKLKKSWYWLQLLSMYDYNHFSPNLMKLRFTVEIVVVAGSTALLLTVPIRIWTQDLIHPLANENSNNVLDLKCIYWRLKPNSTRLDQSVTFIPNWGVMLLSSHYGCTNHYVVITPSFWPITSQQTNVLLRQTRDKLAPLATPQCKLQFAMWFRTDGIQPLQFTWWHSWDSDPNASAKACSRRRSSRRSKKMMNQEPILRSWFTTPAL